MANKFFGERLKELLDDRGWTAAKFAAHFKIDPSAVSHYMGARSNPETDFLIDIADLFDVSVDWLMGRTVDKFSHKSRIKH